MRISNNEATITTIKGLYKLIENNIGSKIVSFPEMEKALQKGRELVGDKLEIEIASHKEQTSLFKKIMKQLFPPSYAKSLEKLGKALLTDVPTDKKRHGRTFIDKITTHVIPPTVFDGLLERDKDTICSVINNKNSLFFKETLFVSTITKAIRDKRITAENGAKILSGIDKTSAEIIGKDEEINKEILSILIDSMRSRETINKVEEKPLSPEDVTKIINSINLKNIGPLQNFNYGILKTKINEIRTGQKTAEEVKEYLLEISHKKRVG